MNKQNRSAWLKWLLITLFVGWFFFVVASYFVVFKPFSPLLIVQLSEINWLPLGNDWSQLGQAVIDLLVALWLILMALGVGLWFFQFLTQADSHSTLEQLLFGFGLGFGAFGLLVLLLGLVGLLQTAVILPLIILLTLTGLPQLLKLRLDLRKKRPSRPISLYLTIAIGMALILAFMPPTNWDGLFYHLKGPKLYLEAGRIYGGVNIPHLNFPSLFQMWFLLGMGIRSDVVAQLIHFLFLIPLSGIVYLLATEHLGLDDGWTAVLFLLATPMILTVAAWTYNDLGLAFFSAGTVAAFLRWQKDNNLRWLTMTGIFAGLAMSMKYTSFVTPLALGLILLWQYRHDWRTGVKPVLLFGITAVSVLSPWLIKNLIFTGNPVYPFLLDGLFWDEFRSAAYANPGSGIGFDLLALLRLPYDMTLGLHDASQDGRTGALFLAFLPLIFFYALREKNRGAGGTSPLPPLPPAPLPPRSSAYRTILLIILAHYLFWTFGVINSAGLFQSRLLLPAFVLLAPLLAYVFEAIREFDHPQFSLRRFMNMAVGFVLFLVLMNQLWGWLPAQSWAMLSGSESREAHLTRRLGTHYLAMQAVNETLSPDAVVAFLWEPRSYYCDRDCRPDSILDEFGHLIYLHNDADSIADAWRQDGVTHVLIWQAGLDFLLENPEEVLGVETAVLHALQTNHLTLTRSIAENNYQLYELR